MLRSIPLFAVVASAVAVAVTAAPPANAQPPRVYRDSIEPHWFAANNKFWYRVDLPDAQREFLVVDAEAGTREFAFDHAAVATALTASLGKPVSPQRLPVDSIDFSDDLWQVVLKNAQGDQWHWDAQAKELLPQPISQQDVDGMRQSTGRPSRDRSRRTRSGRSQSPDAKITAFVRQDNLWLKDNSQDNPPAAVGDQEAAPAPDAPAAPDNLPVSPGTNERQLTTDADSQHTFRRDTSRARLIGMQYDMQDAPADEPDVRWSPTSEFLVAFQTRQVAERRVHYVESTPSDQLQPKLHSYPYLKAGDAIPSQTVRVFRVSDQTEIAVSNELFPTPWTLEFLKWSDDGKRFWLEYNERGHQVLRVLEVSAETGLVRTIIDEHSPTFIHFSSGGKHELRWLGKTHLLWASERSGWNHLYRYDVESGTVTNAVTSGNWNVRRIERVDEESGVVWFYAVGIHADQDPYHEHFCRASLDGTDLTILTDGDGTHSVAWSPDGRFLLDRYSRVDLAEVTELRKAADGGLVCQVEQGDATEVIQSRGQLPQRFTAIGRDGSTEIWGIIHRPANFDPGRKYPVVENIYAGPHDFHVPKAFRTSYRHQQQIADAGFIVVQIDGMGTAWRSKAFHDVCFRNLKDAGFPDRIAWMKAAASQFPEMDLTRVGIYGGSAGGQNAMAALLWHNDFYSVAVADCGCHDNRMDKIWWNEQWMGYPVGEWYAANSNTEHAALLQGDLMLAVGELDRNVDPSSTIQVARRLVQADKEFDLVVIPGAGHGACETPWGSRRRLNFLIQHLR